MKTGKERKSRRKMRQKFDSTMQGLSHGLSGLLKRSYDYCYGIETNKCKLRKTRRYRGERGMVGAES